MAAERDQTYCSVAEAARYLGVSTTTIWRWIDRGRLPAFRVGPKAIRIKRTDLEAMPDPLRSQRASAQPADDKRRVGPARNPATIRQSSQKRTPAGQKPVYTANSLREMVGLPPLTKEQEEENARFFAELDARVITPEERAERRKLLKKNFADRNEANISPMTTADLIRISREEEIAAYGKPRRR